MIGGAGLGIPFEVMDGEVSGMLLGFGGAPLSHAGRSFQPGLYLRVAAPHLRARGSEGGLARSVLGPQSSASVPHRAPRRSCSAAAPGPAA